MGYHMSRLERKVESEDEDDDDLDVVKTRKSRRRLNGNRNLGFRYEYHTLLHLAALRGMPNLLRVLLDDFGGDPNWLNRNMETSLHVPCTRSRDFRTNSLERHKACVKVLLGWRGKTTHGNVDKINLTARNPAGDTALHLAAADGLIGCVEELIKAGISPFVVNNNSFTPHGLAKVLGYYCTAFMLDTIMTFDKDVQDEERSNLRMREDDEACFSFDFKKIYALIDGDFKDMTTLRTVDEALEKSNMGKISLVTEYYRERLTIKWTSDLVECFKLAGISISRSFGATVRGRAMADAVPDPAVDERRVICPLCMLIVKASSRPSVQMKCGHNFCSSCWETYLMGKIDYECQISILCPIYSCKVVIPDRVIENVVRPYLIQKYRSLKLMTLINSGSFIKWCPVADCGLAVRLSVPKYWQKVYEPLEQIGLKPSRAVECGNGHYFCWECLDSCHAPMPCDQWQMWLKRTREHDPRAIPKKIKECAEAVNHLWIAEKSKVCPMCNALTQENDGCRYLTCTQCEYVFRYVCLGVCEIRQTLIGGLIECITPNDYPSSPRGGYSSSVGYEDSSDEDEASRSGNIGSAVHEEVADVNEASSSGYIGSAVHEEVADVNEASSSGYIGSAIHEEVADVNEASSSGYIGRAVHEEVVDVNETSSSGYIGCTIHKECSDANEALRGGRRCFSRCSEISDVSEGERGRYVLIIHKEFSDIDDVLRGRYYTFNRHEDGYEMIDRLRDKYFECTRREEVYDLDEADDKLWAEAIMKTQERRGLKKFNSYYLKYMEMLKLLQREKYYFRIISDRVECIRKVLVLRKDSPEKGKEKAQFLIDGMLELLRLRETLASSYAYAFYLDEMGFNTELLCSQQGELEDLIKKLMDMIVMPQNREQSDLPPRAAVINLTVTGRRTRYRYMRLVINSLYKQEVFSAIKKEKKKLAKRNFVTADEDDKEASCFSVVGSAGATMRSDTIERGNNFRNSSYSWLDFTAGSEFKINETLSDSGVGSCKARGCKRSKVRNSERQEVDHSWPRCMPNDTQRPGLYIRPWRSAEILQKISDATAEGLEMRNASSQSPVTHTPQDVNANGATALSMQQQKTDVGVTIGNGIQEVDAVNSTKHSKTDGDRKGESVVSISFENNFQGVNKVAEDTFSRDAEEIIREEVESSRFKQGEEESDSNSGGLEASFSTENLKQLAGDPETNNHLNFDFEEEEDKATEQSPKPTEKPGDKMSRDSAFSDLQYFRQNLPPRTTEGEVTNRPLNYIKTEAKISLVTDPSVLSDPVGRVNGKINLKQNELMDSSRGLEKEFVKSEPMQNLLDEASNSLTFFKQEDYFKDTSNCSQTSQVKPKGNGFPRRSIEMIPTGKANDGENMVLENKERDFRSTTDFMKSKDQAPKPFPMKREDFCAPRPVRRDNNPKKEHKKQSTSENKECSTKKHSPHTEDSSFEYESITGLPKSTNLCISGVFITRTPESGHISRKDAQMMQSSSATLGRHYSSPKVQEALERYKATGRMFGHSGGSDRSSSLSDRRYDSNSLNAGMIYGISYPARNTCIYHRSVTPPRYSFSVRDDPNTNRMPCNFGKVPSHSVKDSQTEIATETEKSPVASEPEERRTFPLHKSPTEGALSSVLHVNENYLSEDDFHEVFFFTGRSQKDPSKKKKKRERDRKMEPSRKEDRDDFSSAL